MNFRIAVKHAIKLKNHTGLKHMVILWQGKYAVVTKQRMKELYNQGYFKKGLNFREVMALALFTTN